VNGEKDPAGDQPLPSPEPPPDDSPFPDPDIEKIRENDEKPETRT